MTRLDNALLACASLPERDERGFGFTTHQMLTLADIASFTKCAVIKVECDEADPAIAVVTLMDDVAEALSLYNVLAISPDGAMACYDVNQPVYHRRFLDLVTAAQKEA